MYGEKLRAILILENTMVINNQMKGHSRLQGLDLNLSLFAEVTLMMKLKSMTVKDLVIMEKMLT